VAGVTFEDQKRMVHVGPILSMEQSELLMPVSGIIRGVHIQEDLLTSGTTELLSVFREPPQ
jgi:hypothetical protein